MDVPELDAFVAVAETRSFSAAAAALYLTQSAVSRRIAGLERRLDVRLFDRVGRSVALTEAGRALLPRAHSILAAVDDTRTLMSNLDGAVAGALTLATSHHIGLHRLPPVLRTFTRDHPEVKLDLRFVDSEAAHEQLLQGQLEMAVVTLAPEDLPPLESHPLWDDPLVFAAAPEHPLTQRGPLELAELAGHAAVLPGAATYTGRIVSRLFGSRGLPLDAHTSTNYLETIRMMAGIGLGWTVLPATMVDQRLRVLTITDAGALRRSLGWVRHPARTPSNAARAFLDVLVRHADAACATVAETD